MTDQHPRITREKKTINKMVHMYCKGKHDPQKNELCTKCTEFLSYAYKRLDNCPFQEEKSTCGKCLVHCYQPVMKEKAKKIMRYSGPRLIYKSPILALHHVFDGRKKPLTLKELKEKKQKK
ncbi:MAG: nitrous oxide-stimulated promoter family protein [Candidatus Bathyarchaeota archaeon]|nr:nitrous oxide-stimulated promoter family protein [Candidatus Bathyarchaeum tardum]WGM90251.1 MAG: nitrous oxide-stimulated promoter family protein [Candidatus Bathyarchaeum tardum]WNZ29669.1 MAG: nitrous oxide-stimulated promoter family protein [Candidatus Bathyarchaeota archaeon]